MRPFEGIRILDLTHVFAGPFATYQLALMGADVIKIEAPNAPDMMRSEGACEKLNAQGMGTYFQIQSANKRSLTLDLKTKSGIEILEKLVLTADVLVENYAAGALAKLGITYERLSDLNPKLIYCSMTGYGRTGLKAGHPTYDCVVQAYFRPVSCQWSRRSPYPDWPTNCGLWHRHPCRNGNQCRALPTLQNR